MPSQKREKGTSDGSPREVPAGYRGVDLEFGCSRAAQQKARELLADGTQDLYFSAASSWEISIKIKIGKLKLPETPMTYVPKRLAAQAIQSLPVSQKHALAVYDLPMHHADPFDRLLIVQARAERMVLLTA